MKSAKFFHLALFLFNFKIVVRDTQSNTHIASQAISQRWCLSANKDCILQQWQKHLTPGRVLKLKTIERHGTIVSCKIL